MSCFFYRRVSRGVRLATTLPRNTFPLDDERYADCVVAIALGFIQGPFSRFPVRKNMFEPDSSVLCRGGIYSLIVLRHACK